VTAIFREPQSLRPLPPGAGLPPIVQTIAWALAPTWLLDRCARRVGDTFTQTFAPGGFQMVHVSDPQAVKTLLASSEEIAPKPKGGAGAPVWVLGRNSVSVLVGKAHMRQRKLLLPFFHGEHLREHESAIVGATLRGMARWPLGEPVDMQREMRRITLEVIMGSVFGMEGEHMEAMQSTVAELVELDRLTTRLRRLIRGGPGEERPKDKFGRALDQLDAQIYAEITDRRQQTDTGQRSDIMSMLLVARDEDGAALTDAEVRDELVTMLLAGHETTAMTASWAIERLVRHPDKLVRLFAEIDAPPEGRNDKYLVAVVNETLRVRPVQPAVLRTLTQDLQVGRYLLPGGTSVAASLYLTNRNPSVYDNPTAFRPERFLENAPETYSWVPFGGGIRRCVGASFAQMEIKVILRTILAELEPHLPPGRRAWRNERMRWSHRTLKPGRDGAVVWKRRRHRSGSAAVQAVGDPIGALSAAGSHDGD
jgi:cytochrome P450